MAGKWRETIQFGGGRFIQEQPIHKSRFSPKCSKQACIDRESTFITGALQVLQLDSFIQVSGYNPSLVKSFQDAELCNALRILDKQLWYFGKDIEFYHDESVAFFKHNTKKTEENISDSILNNMLHISTKINRDIKKEVRIIVVEWSKYAKLRTDKFGTCTVTRGIDSILSGIANCKTNVKFSVDIIINDCDKDYVDKYDEYASLEFVNSILYRDNAGKDIGGYNTGYKKLIEEAYDGDVIFINSSCAGPTKDYWLEEYQGKLHNKNNIGFIGATMNSHNLRNEDFYPHIQSYFIYTNMEILRHSFDTKLVEDTFMVSDISREDTIQQGEIHLSSKVLEAGYGISSNMHGDYVYYSNEMWGVPLGDIRLTRAYCKYSNRV